MIDRAEARQIAARDPLGRAAIVVPRRLARIANVASGVGLAALVLAPHTSARVLAYFAIGCGIGVATCIPIGIANVMVIDAARRHGGVRAVGTGIGGALADGLYASLGIFGIGPLLARHPAVPRLLHVITGCVLVIYGLVLVRARPLPAEPGDRGSAPHSGTQLARGIAVGLAATLLNPSAVVTWIVLVGSHATGVSASEGGAWVAGIVVGTFAWFLVVTWLALHGQRVLRGNAVWMTRAVGALVVASGLVSLGRTVLAN